MVFYRILNSSKSLQLLFTPLEFFISALADGLPLEFEWQQVFSSNSDSSQYSSRSQKCSSLDGLHSSANFQSLYNPLVTVRKAQIMIGIIVIFMFQRFFFKLPSKVEVTILLTSRLLAGFK